MQNRVEAHETGTSDIETFVRNRYFYGKLMDVFHFDMEQNYSNRKRWLHNRLVSGYGVICGLGVVLTDDRKSIWVDSGAAIDKAGREILVPVRSSSVAIPEAPPPEHLTISGQATEYDDRRQNCDEEGYAHVAISFHECASDPEPVRAGDCDAVDLCAPGSIRERYQIVFVPWKSPKVHVTSTIEDLISGGRINYEALANHVTQNCTPFPDNPSIPLANIKLPHANETVPPEDIDITIRPIVYTNDLLFELIILSMSQTSIHPRANK